MRREVIAKDIAPPPTKKVRYYAREGKSFANRLFYERDFAAPERGTFPIIGFEADLAVLEKKAPLTAGAADPKRRELEAMGVVSSNYTPLIVRFDHFKAPVSGRYKLRLNAFSFWAGPRSGKQWWLPRSSQRFAGPHSRAGDNLLGNAAQVVAQAGYD